MASNGQELERKAEKKLKGGMFSTFFGSKSDRVSDAVDLLKEASSHYKIEDNKEGALRVLIKAAELYASVNDKREAADMYSDAGELLYEDDPTTAVQYLKKAGEMFKSCAQSNSAAKAFMRAGEAYENDLEFELAAENYGIAQKMFSMEKYGKSNSNKCQIKVADLLSRDCSNSDQKNLIQAIKLYESIAKRYAGENLLRHSAKDHFFKACILFLVLDDEVGMEKMMEVASVKDAYFNSSMEKKFLTKLMNAFSGNNFEEFADACRDYSERTTMDRWKTSVLAVISRNLKKKTGAGNDQAANKEAMEGDDMDGENADEEFNPFQSYLIGEGMRN